MAWQRNGTPDTLISPNIVMEIADLEAVTFNQFLIRTITTAGTPTPNGRFNNIANTDYADRISLNGATDITGVNQTDLSWFNGGSDKLDGFLVVVNSINIANEEKLSISWSVSGEGNTNSTVPSRGEHVGKMDTTTLSLKYQTIQCFDNGSDTYAIDSNLSALGTN